VTRPRPDEVVEFDDVIAFRESFKGLCVLIEGELLWLPKVVIDGDSEVKRKGDRGSLMVSLWWANKQGLF